MMVIKADSDIKVKTETKIKTVLVDRTDAKVVLNVDAKITLNKGAEGSAVKTEKANVKEEIADQTADKLVVTDSTGTETLLMVTFEDTDKKIVRLETFQSASGGTKGNATFAFPMVGDKCGRWFVRWRRIRIN